MFESTGHHPQLLGPECYTSQAHQETELANIFLPGWHCIAVTSEMPREGDYRTVEAFGRPLLVWRQNGEYHTFLNVCAHRYCLLTHKEKGSLPSLRCQYHGWEYDCTGNTRKIPDARSFRPLEPGMLGLQKYRTETCGPLIFMTMNEDAPPLREYLGEAWDKIQEWFTPDLQHCLSLMKYMDANWKIQVENALESYHTAEVHPKTFGMYPTEETCQHRFDDHSSRLRVDYSEEKSFRRYLDDFAHFTAGAKPRHTYEHILYLPNLMLARLSLYTWFESMIPIAPGKSLSIAHIFCYGGKPGRLWTVWNSYWVRRYGRQFIAQLAREDGAVLPDVQKGLEAGRFELPKGGLISTREERITHFQEYILRTTGVPRWSPRVPQEAV